jgi:hypothetical protein
MESYSFEESTRNLYLRNHASEPLLEPVCHSVCRAICQQIRHTAALQVHDNRAESS